MAEYEIDKELMADFFDELMEAYSGICSIIDEFSISRKPYPSMDSLFRHLHSIKSNLRMLQLNDISEVIHGLESITDSIRKKEIKYSKEVGGIIILTIEEIQIACQNIYSGKNVSDQFKMITNVIEHINQLSGDEKREAIYLALDVFDPIKSSYFIEDEEPEDEEDHSSGVIQKANFHLDEDLTFYSYLSKSIDKRLKINKEKSEIISKIVLAMNQINPKHLDRDQLQVAIWLHNIGKCMLPLSLVKKPLEDLTKEELKEYQEYPTYGFDFINKNPYWKEAAEIILQHNENVDGSGFPNMLKSDAICMGAQMLSIAVKFADIVLTKEINKITARGIISAVMSLNEEEEKKYSKETLSLFNTAIKHLHRSHKL